MLGGQEKVTSSGWGERAEGLSSRAPSFGCRARLPGGLRRLTVGPGARRRGGGCGPEDLPARGSATRRAEAPVGGSAARSTGARSRARFRRNAPLTRRRRRGVWPGLALRARGSPRLSREARPEKPRGPPARRRTRYSWSRTIRSLASGMFTRRGAAPSFRIIPAASASTKAARRAGAAGSAIRSATGHRRGTVVGVGHRNLS